ncbi:MAG: glycosyltransferase family 2 protein [bacterium]|nr:glycosyltransferase family 2 protein [bacterium]
MKIIFWISIFFLFYVYFIYPFLLAIISKLFPRLWDKADDNFTPPVSFIIPAYNEETVIKAKIENTLSLDYPAPIEIIIADDCSSDQTKDMVINFHTKNYPNHNIVLKSFSKRQGKMGVLNSVIPYAKNDFIILTDANSFFKSDAIKKLIRNFKNPNIGCVGGTKSIITKDQIKNTDNVGINEGLYWKFENFIKQKESILGSTFVDGSIYAIRKETYPFPASDRIIMDDFAVSLGVINKNYRVVFEPEAISYEGASKGSSEEFRRKIRILRGALTSIQIYPTKKIIFQLFSHKILRWISGIFMITLFASNIFIKGTFYRTLLILQIIFYGLTFIGFILEYTGQNKNKKTMPNVFYIPYYFCLTSWAQLIGFLSYSGGKNPAWDKLERNV